MSHTEKLQMDPAILCDLPPGVSRGFHTKQWRIFLVLLAEQEGERKLILELSALLNKVCPQEKLINLSLIYQGIRV